MPVDRRDDMNQYIQSKGEVRLQELELRYPDVSSMTLRRDLENLEHQGRIIRIRGGAKSLAHLSMLKEAAYTQRQAENTVAKLSIADKAVTLVSPGRSIYIDSGTTCMCLAQRLPDQNVFVLTPAPNIALELVKNPNVKINLTGGQLNRDTLTLSGFNATDYVKSLNIDLAFIAASAFSLDNGFTCGDYYEAELKRLIVHRARQVVMLIDSSKINTGMPYTFARLQNLYALISDQPLPDDYQKAAKQAHVLLV
ncbi:MAG: DeoR/GlpR family DNA-binding transcription regulator [Clostridiaceae bacterium]|nr:DeoR/GlpR family DNA-binding transcription regulator [Clostridiaceae bacterium]